MLEVFVRGGLEKIPFAGNFAHDGGINTSGDSGY